MNRLPKWFIGEFVGTFLLVLFGCGVNAVAVTGAGQVNSFHVAIVWGLGISVAIYLTGALSGAHFNPAVTLAMAVWNGFPWRRVPAYCGTQLLGAFVGAAVVYAGFAGSLQSYEKHNSIVRGDPGSEASAMVFGEFFPNPGGKPLTDEARERITASAAFATEVVCTGLLALVILCCCDERNPAGPGPLTPVAIGVTIMILISLASPLTMACFNPARDLGPRLFSALAGWGALPFRVNGLGWLTVYIAAPLLGGQFGGAVYWFFFKNAYRS